MPRRALRPCARPGCRELVEQGRCEKHAAEQEARTQEQRKAYDSTRPKEITSRYQSQRWRQERALYLKQHEQCVECGRRSELVDHVKPWRNQADPERAFWDQGNWQPMCWRCHSRKTARHDGGFGRRTT